MRNLTISLILGIAAGTMLSLDNVPALLWLPVIISLIVGARFATSPTLASVLLYIAVGSIGIMRFTQDTEKLTNQLLNDSSLNILSNITDTRKGIFEKYNLNSESLAIASAMTLGDKSKIPQEMLQTYSESGASHVLALSGMHMAIIYAILSGILIKFPTIIRLFPRYLIERHFRKKKERQRNKSLSGVKGLSRCESFFCRHFLYNMTDGTTNIAPTIILITTLWSYTIFVGMSPSVTRAAIMLSIICIGNIIKRRIELLHSLSLAVFLILVVSPLSLYDVGFQLSFLAVLGIALFYRNLNNVFRNLLGTSPSVIYNSFEKPSRLRIIIAKPVNWLISCLTLTFSAQLFVLPLIAYYFHQIPCYGFLTSIIVAVTATVIVWLGVSLLFFSIATSLTGIPSDWLASPFANAIQIATHIQNHILEGITSLPHSTISGIDLSRYELAMAYIIVISASAILNIILRHSLANETQGL